MWSLNGLDCVNYTGRNHSFHYGECNYKFELPFGMSYKCCEFIVAVEVMFQFKYCQV